VFNKQVAPKQVPLLAATLAPLACAVCR
jgi:hypothetical protein